jgi:hypothetical protein
MSLPQASHCKTAGSATGLELVFCASYRNNVSAMSEHQEVPPQ